MTITVLHQDGKNGKLERRDKSFINEWTSHKTGIIWVDLCDEEPEADTRHLKDAFGIHTLAIQDALRTRHPPKVERFANSLFLLMRGLDASSESVEFCVLQLSIFVGEGFLVTRHIGESVSVNWLTEEVEAGNIDMFQGAGAMVVHLLNRLVRRYVEILLALEPRLDELETLVFAQDDDQLLSELTRYKNRLREIGRIANYHLEVIRQLQRNPEWLGEGLNHEMIDVYEQLERTASLADLYYVMASDLIDGHLAYTSHRLNRVMQILTVITVIFVPLTFIAGIYGMNFVYIPELQTPYGYFVVLLVMFSIGFGLWRFFKRRSWV